MKRLLPGALALGLAVALLCACAPGSPSPSSTGSLGAGWTPDHTMALAYATKFRVDFYAGSQPACTASDEVGRATCEQHQDALITIDDSAGGGTGSRYLVVPPTQPVPTGIDPDIVVLQQPLTNMYVAATSVVSLFVALDALGSVRFTSIDADAWDIPAAKAAMQSGQMLFGGSYSAPDYELIVADKSGLAIENGMIYHSPQIKEQLEAVGIPVLVEQSSYESHPLGRTEWIKLIGVLLGDEPTADKLFDAQAAHLDALTGQGDTGKTVAFFYISSTGYVVTRKSGDYVPAMIKLAGGDYVFKNLGDDTATSTVNLEMEQFYATAKDADFIIYNATIAGDLGSLADFVALNPLLKDFRAVHDGNVWCTDQDFYQDMTGLGQMMTDMHEMLTDPAAPDQLTFLHRLT